MPRILTNLLPTMDSGNWSGTFSTDYAYTGTKSLKLTGTTSTAEITVPTTTSIALNSTHTYYARVYGYQTSKTSATVGFYWPIAEPSLKEGIAIKDAGSWQLYSGLNTRTSFSDGSYQFRLDFNNSKIAGVMYFDGAMLIDLTEAFGAGNEPTQDWMDATIPYFEGSLMTQAGDVLDEAYTGAAQMRTLLAGKYKLEVWGAQGGYRSSSSYAGLGGYSVGTISLEEDTTVYLYAGGAGNTAPGSATIKVGGFNGGGYRYTYNGGGGASDIRIGADSLYARVIVAGGGGSDGATAKKGMYGGGETGGSSTENYTANSSYCGKGGTQTYSGYSSAYTITTQATSGLNSNTTANYCGGFGFGGGGVYLSSGYGGAGGGGWYGGSGTVPDSSGDDDRGGGGGSGYVYTADTASNYPSGCLLNSSYYLTDASTAAGNTSFTAPGGSSETGHSGDGYVRITAVEIYRRTPETPANFRQTAQDYFEIGLAWDAVECTGYNLYRDGTLLATLTGTSYTDTTVQPNTTYQYTLTAYNEYGESDAATLTAKTTEGYAIITPVISSAAFSVNPVAINGKTVLTVSVTDEIIILEPYFYYSGDIYSGEV